MRKMVTTYLLYWHWKFFVVRHKPTHAGTYPREEYSAHRSLFVAQEREQDYKCLQTKEATKAMWVVVQFQTAMWNIDNRFKPTRRCRRKAKQNDPYFQLSMSLTRSATTFEHNHILYW